MTYSKEDSKPNLHLMAQNAEVYRNRGEFEKAFVLLDDIINKLGESQQEDLFAGWVYAHKGAVESQQMAKVTDMAEYLYYRGYGNGVKKILETAIEKFEATVVYYFEKAIENPQYQKDRNHCLWAYSHLGEAYRQQALRYRHLRLFEPKSNDLKPRMKDIYAEERTALETAEKYLKEGAKSNNYWALAHLGATNYDLAILDIAASEDYLDFCIDNEIKAYIHEDRLREAESNLRKAKDIAFENKLLYPWARVYLASTYGIKAKMSQKDGDISQAEKYWQQAFLTFTLALEEDSKIIAPNKNLAMLYERKMSICKTKIEQMVEQLSKASPEQLQTEVKALGELVETAKNFAKIVLQKNREDLALRHYCLAIARLEYYQLHLLKQDNPITTESEDGKRVIQKTNENKSYFEQNINALEKYFNDSDASKTPIYLDELNEDYLRASLYLNQSFYESKYEDNIKQPGDASSLETNLERAKQYLETAFLRSPKLVLKSYLDGMRDLYKDLQEELR